MAVISHLVVVMVIYFYVHFQRVIHNLQYKCFGAHGSLFNTFNTTKSLNKYKHILYIQIIHRTFYIIKFFRCYIGVYFTTSEITRPIEPLGCCRFNILQKVGIISVTFTVSAIVCVGILAPYIITGT